MLKWTNKKCKNFNIYSVARKTPRYIIILHLCTKILDMIYSSWYRVWPTETGNYGSLFALLHPILKTQKIKRKKQLLEISSFYTSVPKTTLIWGMLLETQWDRQTILLFRAIFCPFNPLTTRKIKILKKTEIHLEMSSFYICVPKIMIWCMLPEIWSITDIIFYHFRSIFVVSAPENPGNQIYKKIKKKKKKKKKNHLEISSFYTSVPKIKIICSTVLEIWCMMDVIIFHFGLFFALSFPLPPTSNCPKNLN